MLSILVFILVVALLAADACIFFTLGTTVHVAKVIKQMKKEGWTIIPPTGADQIQEDE